MSNLALLGPAAIGAAIAVRTFAKRGSSGVGGAGRAATSATGSGSTTAAGGPKPVPVDPTYGDPELAALRNAVANADWPATEAILRPCRERGDHERLTWLITCVDDLGGDFLLTLPERQPGNALALTLSGARHVAWAWEARTGARASQVSQEKFRIFHERLQAAEAPLYAAVEADPESATPWCFLTTISRGLEHGHEVTRRRFEAGVRRDPHHVALHASMLQQICAKWSGSHEQMHGFARRSLEQAPPGSGIGVLTATAHLEHWLDLPKGEDAAYMRSGGVLVELKEAAAASVLHPAYAPTDSPHAALNAFAMAFWLAGDRATAHDLFRRIGDRPTRLPWGYAGNAGRVFATARQECKKRK
ncbi:hypothetical protein ACEZDB_00850 [Streptacidiphilus sp. N1-3]|uniref:DUF4034 domain-containing protein n=1 Tax=Streptacidiphilus alkalitolerans TaxID=3342712 RepID=A0ABV6WU95_9ACTN